MYVKVGFNAQIRVRLDQHRRHISGAHKLQTERLDTVIDVFSIHVALRVCDVEVNYKWVFLYPFRHMGCVVFLPSKLPNLVLVIPDLSAHQPLRYMHHRLPYQAMELVENLENSGISSV